jgi:hypothetical protein
MQVALADGSVRQLQKRTTTWWALCTPNGGETPGGD